MAEHSSIRHVSPRKRSRRPQNDAVGEAALPPIVERPDGFYWLADGDLGEFGPFETYETARADRDAVSEEALTPAEALEEAERDLGMVGWNDAQTGEPAEGSSPPHLPPE